MTFNEMYNEFKGEIDFKLAEMANRNRKSKKSFLSRPKVPDINLKAVFNEYIVLLQHDTSDLNSIGLRGEVQSERWALSIINLIYLDKTRKDTEDFQVSILH